MENSIKKLVLASGLACALISASAYAADGKFEVHNKISEKYNNLAGVTYKVIGPTGKELRRWTYIGNEQHTPTKIFPAGSVLHVNVIKYGPFKTHNTGLLDKTFTVTLQAGKKIVVHCRDIIQPQNLFLGKRNDEHKASCNEVS